MVKKIIFVTLFSLSISKRVEAQSSYPSTAYAVNTDTLYLTAANGSYDFSITGSNITWDYSGLTGISQQRLIFRNPKQTGFSAAQWPYLQNTNNVNLSSTNGQGLAIGSIQTVNPNDYFKVTSSILEQNASSYDVYIGDKKISVKNTYTDPDVVYKFPLTYGNAADSSTAQYTTSIPNVYYNSSVMKRKNVIDGWGSITTPYGTFANALRIVSTVDQSDSIAINNTGLPKINSTYREIKWMDASKKYPVMIVHQNKVGSQFVTASISFLDVQQFYQPIALFAFYPLLPMPTDTLRLQNLSTNSLTFSWNFGDPSSGVENTSTLTNPQHIYTTAGQYQIKLKAYNGPLVDSITLPVQVGTTPTASFTYSPVPPFVNDVITFQNQTTNGVTFVWDFGDATSTDTDENPSHAYTEAASYQVKLKAYNGTLVDSTIKTIQVNAIVTAITPNTSDERIVYPNPFEEELTIGATEHYTSVKITDLSGQILYENPLTENKIVLSGLQKGYYLLFLTETSGKQVQIKAIKK